VSAADRDSKDLDDKDLPAIDARGMRCPMPVIALARHARDAEPGDRVRLLADDPAAEADIPAWCRLKGHSVEVHGQADHTAYLVVLDAQGATNSRSGA
jgi:tRNA 2-thiouridine synthesizing protein A